MTIPDEGFAKAMAAVIEDIVDAATAPLIKRLNGLEAKISKLILHEARLSDLESRPELKYVGVWRDGLQLEPGALTTHKGASGFVRSEAGHSLAGINRSSSS